MSKVDKSINVEIKAADSADTYDVTIGKKVIGTINQVEESKFEAVNSNGEAFHVKTFDEGVQTLVKYFHLHH